MTSKRTMLDRFKSLVKNKAGTATSAEPLREKLAEKNRRIRKLWERLEDKDREIEKLRDQLDEARSVRWVPTFFDTDKPVFFVVGQGKSGTTWLRNVLNSHPEVLCKGEGRFFERDFVQAAPPEDLQKGWLKSVQPTSLYGAISSSEHLRGWIERSVWTDGEHVDEHLGNLSRLAVNYFLTRRLSETEKRIVGDKTTFSSGEILREIGTLYPEAKVVHIIRDGRDVAVSMIHHMWNYAKDAGAFYDLGPKEVEKRDAYRENLLPSAESLFTGRRLTNIARTWARGVGQAAEDGPRLLGDSYAEVRRGPAGEARGGSRQVAGVPRGRCERGGREKLHRGEQLREMVRGQGQGKGGIFLLLP